MRYLLCTKNLESQICSYPTYPDIVYISIFHPVTGKGALCIQGSLGIFIKNVAKIMIFHKFLKQHLAGTTYKQKMGSKLQVF